MLQFFTSVFLRQAAGPLKGPARLNRRRENLPIAPRQDAVFRARWHGAEGRTRTDTGFPTTPSRWRVYQFHHFGTLKEV